MEGLKYLILIAVCIGLVSCDGQEQKINGVSFVAWRVPVDSTHVNPVLKINANYAAVMPFGFIRTLNSPEITYNSDRQWFGETREGAKQYITKLQESDIKIMLKPQLWVWKGEFTGDIVMKSEDDWLKLEKSYSQFIMEYADLAQEVKADLFCIGTELGLFVKFRPEYWFNLIRQIQSVYKGKLTYAANWDEFRRVPFWPELDFIGIDAYFPVSDKQTPSVEDCIEGWTAHKPIISKLSKENQKSILFTEYGYRSVDFTGKAPWVSDRSMNQVNLEAQVNATKALYETFWQEDWFAGGFIWKWFINDHEVGGMDNAMFTPQNKPVEAVIKHYYSQ